MNKLKQYWNLHPPLPFPLPKHPNNPPEVILLALQLDLHLTNQIQSSRSISRRPQLELNLSNLPEVPLPVLQLGSS